MAAADGRQRPAMLGDRPVAAPAVHEHPPDPASILHRLRTAFPAWGFLHDRGRWIACRGRESDGITIFKSDPVALQLEVSETGRDRLPGHDRGSACGRWRSGAHDA